MPVVPSNKKKSESKGSEKINEVDSHITQRYEIRKRLGKGVSSHDIEDLFIVYHFYRFYRELFIVWNYNKLFKRLIQADKRTIKHSNCSYVYAMLAYR